MGRPAFPESALAAAALSLAACALAQTTVTRVTDGDTVVLSDGQHVRLAEIDAPESCQPSGKASTAALVALCLHAEAEVLPTAQDRYGRTVARLRCSGTDAGDAQVRQGWAWVYRRYAPGDSPLYHVEAGARANSLGLWALPSPIPPWEFRRAHGPCR